MQALPEPMAAPASWLLDICHLDVNFAGFPCVSLYFLHRHVACHPVFVSFLLLYTLPLSLTSSCLSLNVTRLVRSFVIPDTCNFVLELDSESCSADGSQVVTYCGLPLPPILPRSTTCLLVPPAHEILHRHQIYLQTWIFQTKRRCWPD